MHLRISIYVGYPECIAFDQGPEFQSQKLLSLINSAGILVHP